MPEIKASGALQAFAGMRLGTGVKRGQLPVEVLKAVPFSVKLEIEVVFREYAEDLSIVPEVKRRTTEFISVPKELPVERLVHLRWVGKSEVLQQNGIWAR